MANLRKILKYPTGLFSLKWCLPPLLTLGWLTGAWGGALSDPTLPPPAWLAAQAGTAATVEQDTSTGVQLVLIGKSRKLAVIDGQVVKPGDIHNGSKVLAIKPGEVVLQDASKSLKLTPNVEKKIIAPPPLKQTGSAVSKGKKTRHAASKHKKLVNGNGGKQ